MAARVLLPRGPLNGPSYLSGYACFVDELSLEARGASGNRPENVIAAFGTGLDPVFKAWQFVSPKPKIPDPKALNLRLLGRRE